MNFATTSLELRNFATLAKYLPSLVITKHQVQHGAVISLFFFAF